MTILSIANRLPNSEIGKSLEVIYNERVKRSGFLEQEIMHIAEKILNILCEIHDRGITYGILSLENIFIANGEIFLKDISECELVSEIIPYNLVREMIDPRKDIRDLGNIINALLKERGDIYPTRMSNQLTEIAKKATGSTKKQYQTAKQMLSDIEKIKKSKYPPSDSNIDFSKYIEKFRKVVGNKNSIKDFFFNGYVFPLTIFLSWIVILLAKSINPMQLTTTYKVVLFTIGYSWFISSYRYWKENR